MKATNILSVLAFLFSATVLFAGTTGKITGVVTDAKTGEKLVSANIIIEGTTIGAATNLDGYFVILNVPPGSYRLKSSLLGYNNATLVDVRVIIDQTTNVTFALTEASLTTQEVVIVAQRPVVQKDVSASTTNLNFKEFQNLPAVKTISNILGLQAGIQTNASGDFIIRGGGADQTAFMLDGNTLRDERTNKAFSGISLSSVEDIQIQTGGFNAEYGNVRSGIVNVITKEGSPSRYTVSVIARYSPVTQKRFGPSPNDGNSFWIRPYTDPTVCWTGTKNGAWDPFTQNQYSEFEGWNALAAKTLGDTDPTNDLTPEAAQRVFLWQHRKVLDITKPDYDIDASFGGPVPYGEGLGNLRFFASYREATSMYVVPLSDYYPNAEPGKLFGTKHEKFLHPASDGFGHSRLDNYFHQLFPLFPLKDGGGNQDYNAQLKITSDISSGMKLTTEFLVGRETGTNNNNAGLGGIFTTPAGIGNVLNRVSYIDARIFATDYWAPASIERFMYGAKFTHVLSPATFYEVSIHNFGTSYSTAPAPLRDTSRVYRFGNSYYLDEAPFGFQPQPSTGIDGLRMGVGFSNSRDSSEVIVLTARADITSQIDRYNQLKAGVEYIYTDNYVNYASVDIFLPSGRSQSVWRTFPIRGAVYVQDKFEYEGMVLNLGMRVDYSNPKGDWFAYSDPRFNLYDPNLVGDKSLLVDQKLPMAPIKKNVTLSPRLGVSFPITELSKLYFNYGHFRSMPTPENLFLVRRFSDNNNITYLANPNNPLPKTVAYELGYEHSLFEEYLFRLAGYYKDVTNQLTTTTYVNPSIGLSYSLSTDNSYQDIRGFEITLTKNRGNWVNGFVNYTYMVSTSGRFGYSQFSSKQSDQRVYERDNIVQDLYQSKPVPQPYGRANIDFFTPSDFGPTFGNVGILSDWRLSLLGNWSAGSYFTWAGGGSSSIPGLQNNVQWKDFYNLDLRLSKTINFSHVNLQLFVDASNLMDIRYFDPSGFGFKDGNDFDAYMKSLHLPGDIVDKLSYGNIPGDDQPGDYRKDDVVPVPMVYMPNTASVTNPVSTYIYYDNSTKTYMKYANNQWVPEDQNRVDQVLKDKAYVDMPNLNYFTFLNPRRLFFGVRVTFGI